MSKIYVPGIEKYGQLKSQFLDAEKLLSEPETNASLLSKIVREFDQNPLTARFLRADFGQRYDTLYSSVRRLYQASLQLDKSPADNGSEKTQHEWFSYWDTIDDGRVMASMGDLYQSFKQLKTMSEEGNPGEKSFVKKIRDGLRADFSAKKILGSSTKIEKISGSDMLISHHYGSCSGLYKEHTGLCYDFSTLKLDLLLSKERGFDLLQKILDTNDSKETILDTLYFIAGQDKKIYTSLNTHKNNDPIGLVSFRYFNNNQFVIVAMNSNAKIRTRGIKI
jgi:hypothetical protein